MLKYTATWPGGLSNTVGDPRWVLGHLGRARCPLHVARRPMLFTFGSRAAPRGLPGATFGRFSSILGRFSSFRALLVVTFYAPFAKNEKKAFVCAWPHETRVGPSKK